MTKQEINDQLELLRLKEIAAERERLERTKT